MKYCNDEPCDQELSSLSIEKFLYLKGFQPISRSESEILYHDVFITDRRTSIFKVNSKLDTWYDLSLKKGGNILDLIALFWPEHTSEERKKKIKELLLSRSNKIVKRARMPVKIPHYQIDKILPLGGSRKVQKFLEEIGLWDIADHYLREVHYYYLDFKGKRKNFTAVGWENENHGWEIRSYDFEDCIGPTGMTFHSRSSKVIAVFKDYPAYLRCRNENQISYASILILNQMKFLTTAVERTKIFEQIIYQSEIQELIGRNN